MKWFHSLRLVIWLKSKVGCNSESKQDDLSKDDNVYDYYINVDEDIKRRERQELLDDVNRELRKYW